MEARRLPTGDGHQENETVQEASRTFEIDKHLLKEIQTQRSWDELRRKILRELAAGEVIYLFNWEATVAWASDPNEKSKNKSVLFSFYDGLLSEHKGQLAFKALLNPDKSAAGISITYWPKSTETLKPLIQYFRRDSAKNGYPLSDEFSLWPLILGYINSFIHQSDVNNGMELNEEDLCKHFVHSLKLVEQVETSTNVITTFLQNSIETDAEVVPTHMFLYKTPLAASKKMGLISKGLRNISIFMHWGVIFKFEKESAEDVYWTLDGGQRGELFDTSEFVVRARRSTPSIIENPKKSEFRVTYFGSVLTSPQQVIITAKRLKNLSFCDSYKLISRNCQEWALELLSHVASTSITFWISNFPEALASNHFDSSGNRKEHPMNEPRTSMSLPDEHFYQEIKVDLQRGGKVVKTLTATNANTYELLLNDIAHTYGIQREDFAGSRRAELYIRGDSMIIKYHELHRKAPQAWFTIRTLANDQSQMPRFVINICDHDFIKRTGFEEKGGAVSFLSFRLLLKMYLIKRVWLLAISSYEEALSVIHQGSTNSFVKEIQPMRIPGTAKDKLGFKR